MRRRNTLLTCALGATVLTVPLLGWGGPAGATSAPTSAGTSAPAVTSRSADPAADTAVRRLRQDADGGVRVHRDATTGRVDLVRSSDGAAMVAGGARSPRAAAVQQLARYGAAVGLGGSSSAVVTQVLPSAAGGSVVRAAQRVDGVPVFGGQVVLSLDAGEGVVSMGAATTDASSVPAPEITREQARATALTATAKRHHVPVSRLSVTDLGRQVFDPSLLHLTDPAGTRPVWAWQVSDGREVRETVLVGTGRGEVALRFNDVPELRRAVCDNAGRTTTTSAQAVPVCANPARVEGGAASSVTDVDQAYDNLGATARTYSDLGVDLTSLIGVGGTTLTSTVRWCFSDTPCPLDNAFWDGTQMVFGSGYAGADDVVGHELTHGYVERTAGLFYLHQSGAINESVADVMGEIVDHRNPATPDDDSAWTIGEDLPGDSIRSLADPTLSGQPDRTGSPAYGADDARTDLGDVHQNDGVGNKTAYLISQGGTFNGHTVTGIDEGDPSLTKTARLYVETIPRLTSGADYAALGQVLQSTCAQLVSTGTDGFVQADCDSVAEATAATELAQRPAVLPASVDVPVACSTGQVVGAAPRRDDDGYDGFAWSFGSLWNRVPGGPYNEASYAVSGQQSLLGYDPNPDYGDPSTSALTSAQLVVPTASGGTFLNFHHAYVFEYDPSGYWDGGRVVVSALVDGAWRTVSGLPWVNGPDRHVVGDTTAGFTGFAGDSFGYRTSQLDLSSLAGKTVRISFQVVGDETGSAAGWWLDDIRLYTCGPSAPGAATISGQSSGLAAGRSTATVSWAAPTYAGSGVTGYRVTPSVGSAVTTSAAARSQVLSGFSTGAPLTVTVQPLNAQGETGPAATARFYPTATSTTSSVTSAVSGRAFTVTAKVVRRGSTSVVPSMRVALQRRVYGTSTWRAVSSGTTGSRGTKAWSVRQTAATYYRVVSSPTGRWFTSTSAARLVRKR